MKPPSTSLHAPSIFLEQLAIRERALSREKNDLRITFTDKQIYERIFKFRSRPTCRSLFGCCIRIWRILNGISDRCGRAERTAIRPAREQFDLFELHYAIRNHYQNRLPV